MLCLAFSSLAEAELREGEAAGKRAETPAVTGFADVDAHLAALFKNYSSTLTAVDKEHSTSLGKLTKNYDNALERQMNFYQEGGSPAGALAVRRERQRLKEGQPVADGEAISGSGELEVLAEQQSRFLDAKGSLEATRDEKIDSTNTKLREALQQYQSQLTREGLLDRVAVVAKIATAVPRAIDSSSIGSQPSLPTTQQELAAYLEGTTWTWMGGKPAHAKFLPGQQYETSNDATGRIFGRWPYTITKDLELTSPYQNKIFKFEFDKNFKKVEVFEEPGNIRIRYGKLESRDSGDSN